MKTRYIVKMLSSNALKNCFLGGFALSSLGLCGTAMADNYSDSVLADSPSVYYRFQDVGTSVYDSGSAGINGTATASATQGVDNGPLPPTYQGFQQDNKAISFTGNSSSYVSMSSVSLQGALNGASAVTVEMWINPDSLGSTMDLITIPIRAYGPSYTAGIQVSLLDDGRVRASGRSIATDSFKQYATASSVSASEWTYLAVIFNYADDYVEVYANGAPIATSGSMGWGSDTYSMAISTGTLYDSNLGRNPGGTAPYTGDMDELALYSYALTASDIAAHYEAALIPESQTWAFSLAGCIAALALSRSRRKRGVR